MNNPYTMAISACLLGNNPPANLSPVLAEQQVARDVHNLHNQSHCICQSNIKEPSSLEMRGRKNHNSGSWSTKMG